jgi:alpha-galactosidase
LRRSIPYNERSTPDCLSTLPSPFRRSRPAARCQSTHAVVCLGVLLCGAGAAAGADRPPLIASRGDAFVAHQDGSDLWSIGSASLELSVGLDASRTLTLQRLFNPVTGRAWAIAPGADVTLTAGGERIALTAGGAVTFVSATAQTTDNGVTLTFAFESRSQRLIVSRVYACYPGSPTIETWTRLSSTGGDGTTVTDLMGFQMTMPLGRVRWLGGLRGDSADNSIEDAFVVVDRDLEPAERIEIGSEGRSSETFVPLLFVDGERDAFYAGLMWSGAWHAALERADQQLRVSLFFPSVATMVTASRPLELPHTFFGVSAYAVSSESGALHQFILNGIRHGRPFQPLVTYNTWFIYGTTITEDLMVTEMDRAAALGVELFVMDAGWYQGAGETGDFDFDSGLGTWAEDSDRFPSGLASLSDYAHGVGMKFGLWVEPERVALSTVDKPGLTRESWLATRDGDYGALSAALICLTHPEARQWVLDRLIALIDRVRPDYLKWDNNFWINCNRPGHGHGLADGNFTQVQSLYTILDALRRRYPDLLIENVSGGGARIDFGMLAYTDTAWMDDRTAPSSLVRHNLEGLTFAFPPAYLLSFLIDADGEPIAGAADLPLLSRSRAAGVFGLTYRSALLDDDTAARLAEQIRQYKTYRGTIATANASLLSDQAPVDETSWDVIQEVADGGRSALIFAFKGSADAGRMVVRPRNLLTGVTYDVTSLDTGPLGSALGEVLMQDGIEIVHGTGSRAHVLVLTAR